MLKVKSLAVLLALAKVLLVFGLALAKTASPKTKKVLGKRYQNNVNKHSTSGCRYLT